MNARVHQRLLEFGRFVVKYMDFSDELGENILFRFSEYGYTDADVGGVKVDSDGASLGRDSVLCPDMPARLRQVDAALRKLGDLRESCLRLNYCAPVKGDGRVYTVSELARMLQINKGKFRAEVNKGRNDLEKLI